MSHLSSGTVSGLSNIQVQVASLYRLGWRTVPNSNSWDTFASSSYWGDAIRWFLFPLLEPDKVDGPFTVICSAGPYAGKGVTSEVADAHATLCGLTRNTGESDDSLNRRCLQTEPVS